MFTPAVMHQLHTDSWSIKNWPEMWISSAFTQLCLNSLPWLSCGCCAQRSCIHVCPRAQKRAACSARPPCVLRCGCGTRQHPVDSHNLGDVGRQWLPCTVSLRQRACMCSCMCDFQHNDAGLCRVDSLMYVYV